MCWRTVQYWNWNANYTSGGVLSGKVNTASWQNLKPYAGSTSSFGYVVVAQANYWKPGALTVNGVACTVE